MENNTQVMMKEKLNFNEILKEALKIPYKNPNFIIFTFFTSFPLFLSMLIYETIFQQTLIQTAKILQETLLPNCKFCYDDETPMEVVERLLREVSHKFFLLGFLYLAVIHFLDLLNTVAIINSASAIYAEEKKLNLKDMFCRPINEIKLKGPFITSIYVLLLSALILFGLFSLAVHIYIASQLAFSIMVLFVVLFVALLTKYLDWNAIWNMGIVISVLAEKHGDVALVVSGYLSRGRRQRGFFLMLVFSVWSLALRLLCLYVKWYEGGSGIVVTGVQISLVCLGNVMKWMVFVVYFYDCKSRSLEKRVDAEEGCAGDE